MLVECILERIGHSKIAYVESHAGAGYFRITKQRISQVAKDKVRLSPDPLLWQFFDRYNGRIQEGIYLGSFVLVLHRLADWQRSDAQREVRGCLWENHTTALERINEFRSELIPASVSCEGPQGDCATPDKIIEQCRELSRQGFYVLWFCDPYFGQFKEADRVWWKLLSELRDMPGMIFGYVRGNSRMRGSRKFDFRKVIGAPNGPWRQAEENIRAYGLFLTEAANRLVE
ncbi:MAG: hypothetical protein Q8R91_03980 [Candidatus Omnitrophota bacterium]|nr:hypothetical protein [Candidatus Omnitrophota bacterium]